jgi:hypothetical protein
MIHSCTSLVELLRMPIIPRRDRDPLLQSQPFRIGPRSLLIVSFAGIVLVALSGAVLVGLAAVGVLAAVVWGFDLIRRQIWRPARPPLAAG